MWIGDGWASHPIVNTKKIEFVFKVNVLSKPIVLETVSEETACCFD